MSLPIMPASAIHCTIFVPAATLVQVSALVDSRLLVEIETGAVKR